MLTIAVRLNSLAITIVVKETCIIWTLIMLDHNRLSRGIVE
jgi:hypothetical protein